MTIIELLVIVAILVFTGMMYRRTRKPAAQQEAAFKSRPQGKNPYEDLRKLALQSSRGELGIPAPATKTQPWGAIMDWGLSEGWATVVAFSDGNASVYLSNGGGYLGGTSREAIRSAAKRMVAFAGDYQPQMRLADGFPLPRAAQVAFYVLTDAGTFTATASQEELSSHRHALSKLGDAAQDVITQYRLLQSGPKAETQPKTP